MNALPRFALVLLGVLSVADLSLPFVTDGDHPPMSIAVVAAALGAAFARLPARRLARDSARRSSAWW